MSCPSCAPFFRAEGFPVAGDGRDAGSCIECQPALLADPIGDVIAEVYGAASRPPFWPQPGDDEPPF